MYSASDLKKNLKIEIEGDPCVITDFEFSKPGKGQALYKCRIKNMITGNTFDRTYRSVDKIDEARLQSKTYIYSYREGNHYIFMDAETYDQLPVSPEILGDQEPFLQEDMEVEILLHNARPIEVTLPFFVDMKIEETEPGARGDTATNVTKDATVEGGHVIQVPIFVNEGDTVRIDTRTGGYVSRV
ncbi:elongation factor P [Kiritimatiella glycovorans]|uniref:Elongation factor P n=1 Tax=Kiritimatiella glycovorans TaxID=1307763 RepID=A0A0G3EBT6_9BACT|nr:elongation factor P [Kiritimatiella glycovorans]AKJ63768.1 Elongation factor P [Kiritimatiella glycovorans]